MHTGIPEEPSLATSPAASGQAGQWPAVARNWHQLGSPLRPIEADLRHYQSAISSWSRDSGGKPPRALILGVTPELYRLPWPAGSSLKAIDRTVEMAEHVWPGDNSQVHIADWRKMEWPEASFDLVLCDGGLHLLDFPEGQQALAIRLKDIVSPGGRFVVRLFVPPAEREEPEHVLRQLHAGLIPDLNCLKLRLGMALQESATEGVGLHAVWARLRASTRSWSALANRLGWLDEHLAVIDAYQNSCARYHFVTAMQVEQLICEDTRGPFRLQSTGLPGYLMGAQCPILEFLRTPS